MAAKHPKYGHVTFEMLCPRATGYFSTLLEPTDINFTNLMGREPPNNRTTFERPLNRFYLSAKVDHMFALYVFQYGH